MRSDEKANHDKMSKKIQKKEDGVGKLLGRPNSSSAHVSHVQLQTTREIAEMRVDLFGRRPFEIQARYQLSVAQNETRQLTVGEDVVLVLWCFNVSKVSTS